MAGSISSQCLLVRLVATWMNRGCNLASTGLLIDRGIRASVPAGLILDQRVPNSIGLQAEIRDNGILFIKPQK